MVQQTEVHQFQVPARELHSGLVHGDQPPISETRRSAERRGRAQRLHGVGADAGLQVLKVRGEAVHQTYDHPLAAADAVSALEAL